MFRHIPAKLIGRASPHELCVHLTSVLGYAWSLLGGVSCLGHLHRLLQICQVWSKHICSWHFDKFLQNLLLLQFRQILLLTVLPFLTIGSASLAQLHALLTDVPPLSLIILRVKRLLLIFFFELFKVLNDLIDCCRNLMALLEVELVEVLVYWLFAPKVVGPLSRILLLNIMDDMALDLLVSYQLSVFFELTHLVYSWRWSDFINCIEHWELVYRIDKIRFEFLA